MRVPKTHDPRIQRWLLKKFGKYEKVLPVETTPSRKVPDHIKRPNYISKGKTLVIPKFPEVKDLTQIQGMRCSCKLASRILGQIQDFVKPGITTDEIDEFAQKLTVEAGAYPSPLHYNGFPKSVCTSVNNVAVHGIPDLRLLKDGDIVNVDITVFYNGFHGDCSKTFLIGNVDDQGLELVRVTEECLDVAIKVCGPDTPFNEIGAKIQRHAQNNRLTVIPAIIGHGIGAYFHGPPDVYHINNTFPGLMKSGMTFTIEPVLSHGSEHTVILEDGWTVITEDNSRAAQVEHTVLITDNGAEVLT